MNDEKLLRDLKSHFPDADTQAYSVLDFAFRYGSVLEALMFSRLLWPEFVEFEGMIFLKETAETVGFGDQIKGALKKFGGKKSAVERSFNLREVTTQLLGKDLKATTDEQIDCLEKRLVEMWEARLSKVYPIRRFVVEVVAFEPDDPESETGVTFYQRSP